MSKFPNLQFIELPPMMGNSHNNDCSDDDNQPFKFPKLFCGGDNYDVYTG
jgi:hypothetical protein